jgi:hypothetical protein
MLAEWAYAPAYRSSDECTAALSGWLERFNTPEDTALSATDRHWPG